MTATDDVAPALIRLSASVANMRSTDVVSIPIALGPSGETGIAAVVVGAGTAVLAEPTPWHGEEPDFSTDATLLKMHRDYPHSRSDTAATVDASCAETVSWDPDLDG